jgi:GNAT superfamily N-acetyltransferase
LNGDIFLDNIFVDSNHRNKGYATKIIKKLLTFADRYGVAISLDAEETYDDDGEIMNTTAFFWRRFGFEETERQGKYGIIMIRKPNA